MTFKWVAIGANHCLMNVKIQDKDQEEEWDKILKINKHWLNCLKLTAAIVIKIIFQHITENDCIFFNRLFSWILTYRFDTDLQDDTYRFYIKYFCFNFVTCILTSNFVILNYFSTCKL